LTSADCRFWLKKPWGRSTRIRSSNDCSSLAARDECFSSSIDVSASRRTRRTFRHLARRSFSTPRRGVSTEQKPLGDFLYELEEREVPVPQVDRASGIRSRRTQLPPPLFPSTTGRLTRHAEKLQGGPLIAPPGMWGHCVVKTQTRTEPLKIIVAPTPYCNALVLHQFRQHLCPQGISRMESTFAAPTMWMATVIRLHHGTSRVEE